MPKIKIAYDKAPLKKGDKGPFIYHGQQYASYDDLVKAVGTDKLSYVGYRYEDVSEDDPRYLEQNKVVLEPVEVIGNRTFKPGMVVPTASAEDLKQEAITDFDNIVFTGGELQGREVPTEFSSDGKTSFERALSGKRDPRGAKEYRANLEAIGMNPIFGNTRVQNSHNAWAKNPQFMQGWTNAQTLASSTLLSPFAIPTAVEAAPAVGNWLMNTGMPWVAKYTAAPTAAGMTWDLTQKALTGTTTTEQISNYLQQKGWNPVISEMVGGISNPGYWINFGGVGKYTRPLFNKIGLGLSNPSAPIELSPTIQANINASMPKSKFQTKVVEPVTNFYNTTRNAMIPAIIGTRMRIMPLGKIQTTQIPLNVGWGPRQTISVTHKSDQAFPLSLYNEQRWDVLNEGANPFGIWFQGKLGIPRTTNTGATPIKAEKALKARQLFSRRPYTHSGDLTLDKPLVTIGDVPDRSLLSYQAERLRADGLIYNNVYDNGYDANQVLLSFKQPDASKKQFFKFPSFDNLYQIMEQQKQLQKIERQNSVNQGIDDVLNYIGSKKHVNQIMRSGVSEKDATRIANDMRYNVLATDVQLDYPILSNALGEFDSNFGPASSNVLRPNYTFKPVTRTNPLLDEETIRRNIHHELGGHGATVGYNPNYYNEEKLQSIYETAMQDWSPSYKQIYDHNKKLVPERLPQYKHSTDPHIKYLEGVDEYSARARSELIQENNEGFNELYKYFTKESVDKLKNNIWLLLPAMLGTGTVITNNR